VVRTVSIQWHAAKNTSPNVSSTRRLGRAKY
jgi:hypothetical protein